MYQTLNTQNIGKNLKNNYHFYMIFTDSYVMYHIKCDTGKQF